MMDNPGRVMLQVFGHAARLAGVPLPRYATDAQDLANCQAEARAFYGYDAVYAASDNSVEAEAMGAKVFYPDDDYPYILEHPLRSIVGLDRLEVPDPRVHGRMPVILEACRLLRRASPPGVTVVGYALGPVTLAGQLLGLEPFLYLLADDPAGAAALIELAAVVTTRYARAIIEAGAHAVTLYEPNASPTVLPPRLFRQMALPSLRRVMSSLSDTGAARWVQVPGPARPLLPDLATLQPDAACVDYQVPISEALAGLPSALVVGNLKPLLFVSATPAEIEGAVRSLVEEARQASSGIPRLVPGAGCEVPPASRPDCVKAMVETARKALRG